MRPPRIGENLVLTSASPDVPPVAIDPARGAEHFEICNRDATGVLARFVERFWSLKWDLPPGVRHEQRVVAHPGVTILLGDGRAAAIGSRARAVSGLRIQGTGSLYGVLFRPAGFRPFLGRSMATMRDRELSLTEVFASRGREVTDALSDGDGDGAITRLEEILCERAPRSTHPSETTNAIAEYARLDRALTRVDQLAACAGVTSRQLERRFLDHIGISPKALIRRYRIQEIAERARVSDTDWAFLAAELGYSDQAHLTRDFAAVMGLTPGAYRQTAVASYDCADTLLRYRRK